MATTLAGIDTLRAGLDYHLARHNLLTANLSHVDTPGFRPLDLERKVPFAGALHTAMASTQPGHLGGSGSSVARTEQIRVIPDPAAVAGEDGNAVNLDREAVKIAANNIHYDAIASLVADQLTTLSWAANDGR
jgi:flagellar basal-body rod protein FlgB